MTNVTNHLPLVTLFHFLKCETNLHAHRRVCKERNSFRRKIPQGPWPACFSLFCPFFTAWGRFPPLFSRTFRLNWRIGVVFGSLAFRLLSKPESSKFGRNREDEILDRSKRSIRGRGHPRSGFAHEPRLPESGVGTFFFHRYHLAAPSHDGSLISYRELRSDTQELRYHEAQCTALYCCRYRCYR